MTIHNGFMKKFAKNIRISDGFYVTFRAKPKILNLVRIARVFAIFFYLFAKPTENAERSNTDKHNRSYPKYISA